MDFRFDLAWYSYVEIEFGMQKTDQFIITGMAVQLTEPLEVLVHIHPIMIKIHPVFFLIPVLKSPFLNQAPTIVDWQAVLP